MARKMKNSKDEIKYKSKNSIISLKYSNHFNDVYFYIWDEGSCTASIFFYLNPNQLDLVANKIHKFAKRMRKNAKQKSSST